MLLLLTTLGICFVSALFPLVNAEAYMSALAVTSDDRAVWLLAITAGVGQMGGKIIWYQVGRSSLNWRWVRRKIDSVTWQARLTRWQGRVQGNRWSVAAFLATSAFFGLPPFAIISVLAGQLKVPFALFCATGLAGRILRFAAILGGISALNLT
ncbi:MAG TPA: hypothetical protein VGP51_05560 [Nocardioidaceae bacterium]|nr:hypothetical protein [Actinomycetota bacterium]MDQ3422564.1 hypothetical protein [Actinomycetota bacterium]HEV8055934.1 hypothetical protein [Nocardioidaceae bacterium]